MPDQKPWDLRGLAQSLPAPEGVMRGKTTARPYALPLNVTGPATVGGLAVRSP